MQRIEDAVGMNGCSRPQRIQQLASGGRFSQGRQRSITQS
jgi:hypothetical protein